MRSKNTRIKDVSSTLLGIAAISVQTAHAAEPPSIGEDYDKFSMRAGAFVLNGINTKLSLNPVNEPDGDYIDFKTDLGGEDSLTLFRVDADWRFASKHRLQLSYFDINQNASKALTGEIEWGDEVFPVDTTVNSHFGTAVTRLSYGYTFYRSEKNELIGLIGAHVTGVEASIATTSGNMQEGLSVTAPLPVLGLEWRAKLSDRFNSRVSFEYFGIDFNDEYEGNLSTFQAILDYSLSEQWKIGGGYERYTIGATARGEYLELSVRHNYNGLMAYVGFDF